MRVAALLCALLWADVALGALDRSERPKMRPSDLAVADTEVPTVPSAPVQQAGRNTVLLEQSLRPRTRTRKIQRAARTQERRQRNAAREVERLSKLGAVCGVLGIKGIEVQPIKGRIAGCGIANPVRIREVSSVALSQQSLMTCQTAMALKSWVDNTAKPTLAKKGGGLAQLNVAAHYVCKTRNSRPGARLSEHAKGRAIDISGVRLRDGTVITVRNGWNATNQRDVMRKLHRGACGPFGTVLGPASDRFHQAHFHFDIARYRSGPYCR